MFFFACLWLDILVNIFSVILGQLPGFNHAILSNGDEVSCSSRTQHRALGEDRTHDLAIKSPTLSQLS